jgi:hypothetical protein
MILGLDLSTSVCGYCYLYDDGSLKDVGYIDLTSKKYKNLYDKLWVVRERFKSEHPEITKVFIEEPAQAFSTSTAWTLSLLQRWNGMVSGVFFTQGINPTLINANHARKLCGIKTVKGVKVKETVFEHVKSLGIIPDSKWQYKKTGKIKDHCMDMTDAYIVARAGYLESLKK